MEDQFLEAAFWLGYLTVLSMILGVLAFFADRNAGKPHA